jgi:hypothetical protein
VLIRSQPTITGRRQQTVSVMEGSVSRKSSSSGQIPSLRVGKYADGMPLHKVKYLECKLILAPNKFTSRKRLFDFAKVLRGPEDAHKVKFSSDGFSDAPLQIREVLFVDTKNFHFYKNAFIVRRRILYKDGFPIGDPEIVLKFRHPDPQLAAETDVRPQITGDHKVKFKCELLPPKDQLGGLRRLFSHNVEFPLSQAHIEFPPSMEAMTRIFPVLHRLKREQDEVVDIVSNTIVEEVLQDIGILDFGGGVTAKANVALWRARGDHRPLIGEFAFQLKFKSDDELRDKAMKKIEAFFVSLQYEAEDWISLGATKTGVVYRLLGNGPSAHE